MNDIDINLKMTYKAAEILRECSDALLLDLFRDANLCSLHSGRTTLIPKDIDDALEIRFNSKK